MNWLTEKIVKFWEDPRFIKHFVSINEAALNKTAQSLAHQNLKAPSWRESGVFPESPQAFVSQTLFECAIDFCFTDPSRPRSRFRIGELTGSMAMASCFYRYFGEKPVDPEIMLNIAHRPGRLEEFFQGNTILPLLEERRTNLEETAETLRQWFDGDPMNLLESAEWYVCRPNGDGMIRTLKTIMPIGFGRDYIFWKEDAETFGGMPNRQWLPFFKRAQLWPLIYQGRALNSNGALPLLRDPREIGPIADNAVPNALRFLNILEYADELADAIDTQKEISAGSRQESEIRGATICAAAKLLEIINKHSVTMVELDYFLWQLGKQIDLPPHLAKTTNY